MADLEKLHDFRFCMGIIKNGSHTISDPLMGNLKTEDHVVIIHLDDFKEHIKAINKLLDESLDLIKQLRSRDQE